MIKTYFVKYDFQKVIKSTEIDYLFANLWLKVFFIFKIKLLQSFAFV